MKLQVSLRYCINEEISILYRIMKILKVPVPGCVTYRMINILPALSPGCVKQAYFDLSSKF